MKNLQNILKLGLLIILSLKGGLIKAQELPRSDSQFYYRFSLGGGFANGYPQQEAGATALGGSLEFALQNKKTVYALGFTGVSEFLPLASYSVQNSISSFGITYGKVYQRKALFSSISAGISLVTSEERGSFISSDPGWFGTSYYEKIKSHTIGIPISAKVLWIPSRVYGIGVEVYANLNSKSSFYGINLCHQFGKLRPKKIQKA